MHLKIHTRTKEGIRILDLQGWLLFGHTAELAEVFDACSKEGDTRIVVNGALLKGVDDDGLGELIARSTELRNAGGALKLVSIEPDHLDLGVLFRMETAFEVFDDEQDAVKGFPRIARFGASIFSNSY